jgi:putative inorganic carbon (HCO3(-)) transporter
MTPVENERASSDPEWRVWLKRFAWIEPFWVVAVGGFMIMPPRFLPTALQPHHDSWLPYFIALLVLAWPIRALAYGRMSRSTPLDWPLWIIILWLPISFWVSVDRALSWEAISYLVFGLALYFALLNWPPAERHPQLIAWSILLIGAGLALAAPLLSELTLSKLFHLFRLESVLKQLALQLPGNVNSNRMAGALVLVFPLYFSLILDWKWSRRRWVPVLLSVIAVDMLCGLVLTQSRGAYLAACVAAAIVLILRWPRLLFALPLVMIGAGIAVYSIGFRRILEALASSPALSGMDARLELWSRGLYALADFPFTGIGIGTFSRVIPVLYPYFTFASDNSPITVHNLLLQVGLDLGLPGLIAYLALLTNVFVLLAKVLRGRRGGLEWTLAAGTAGALAAMLIHGMFDTSSVWQARPAFLPWLLIVLGVQLGLHVSQAGSLVDVHSAPALRSR